MVSFHKSWSLVVLRESVESRSARRMVFAVRSRTPQVRIADAERGPSGLLILRADRDRGKSAKQDCYKAGDGCACTCCLCRAGAWAVHKLTDRQEKATQGVPAAACALPPAGNTKHSNLASPTLGHLVRQAVRQSLGPSLEPRLAGGILERVALNPQPWPTN
jgi:hypothetical protein